MMDDTEYLGDGAYVNFDGYHIILTTHNGIEEQNRIHLEPQVLERFLDYTKRIKAFIDKDKS